MSVRTPSTAPSVRMRMAAPAARERTTATSPALFFTTTAQIAAELGTTERAVEGRLYRIKKALRKALGGDDA